ncbi:MAG: hypothetical protein K2Q26_02890 [Bdellovibrionales bacterium]|nr:hypothetical protein [Bdellovibrionales bacterium]
MKILNSAVVVAGLSLALGACSGKNFDLALDANGFTQTSKSSSVPIDILWVVDNSGSMETSQNMVANNIASFINKFRTTNFDYQIAVTTSEAYRSIAPFNQAASWSLFRDGTDATSHTGVFLINPQTPNLETVFQINVRQGIAGSGDERTFDSMVAALSNPTNLASFPRPGAFLAVIFLTDEEDFSHSGTANIQQLPDGSNNVITDPRLTPISSYLSFLDGLTNSTETQKNYVVNTIAIFDDACRNQLATTFTGRRVAARHGQLTDATGGVKASLCDDFSGIMSSLTDTILELSSKFTLSREPNPSTIEILVNGVLVPSSHWVYNATENSIYFVAEHIPPASSSINVRFLPLGVKD